MSVDKQVKDNLRAKIERLDRFGGVYGHLIPTELILDLLKDSDDLAYIEQLQGHVDRIKNAGSK